GSNTYNNNYYNSDYAETAILDIEDVAGQNTGKTTAEYANGDVASLLNANVTSENGYRPWVTIGNDAVLGPENCNLVVNTNVKGANVELKDAEGNVVKSSSSVKNATLYSNLTTSGVYIYTVSKDGFDTEKGTVIIKDGVNSVSVELGVTVYVTISKDGEFKLSSDESTTMSRVPVKVTNFDVTEYGYDDVYNSKTGQPTVLNAFILTHELYSEGADAFKGTPNNNPAQGNDLFITKFWNEETTQLSYMVNNKYPGEWLEDEGYIWGSTADNIKLRTGDDINVTMYTDYQTPMFYTYFKDSSATVEQGEKVDLELLGFDNSTGYLNPESKGISGSTITVNGQDTEIVTDKDGKASISFDEVGIYTISAKNTDLTINDSKAVITAPVCIVIVTEKTVDVTFDADNGTEPIVKTVKEGGVLDSIPEVPTKEGYTFVGWYRDTDDTTTGYKSDVACTEDVTYKAKWAHVEMLGAQVKLVVDDKSGIRFGTKLYNDGDEIVEKGTLIIPASLLAEGEALTLDTPKVARSIGKVNYEVNEEENYVTYLGTLVNIPKAQFDRQMTAAAYVIYKDKAGNKYTVYSQYPNGSTSVYKLLENNVDWDDEW
ncbi:MAG: InlB B-repeat-containing protein, partial [Intestinibacter sp.]|uniref:InlB B-repeat-containing protein n=1 Tax=Intestinibacter sp. TaxID=1965304 RepID=UPI003F169D2F